MSFLSPLRSWRSGPGLARLLWACRRVAPTKRQTSRPWGVDLLEHRTLLSAGDIPSHLSVSAEIGAASEIGPSPAIFRITRTGDLSFPLEAHFSFGGTAQLGVDYLAWEKTAVFETGSDMAFITVLPRNDAVQEGDETITLTLDPGGDYTVGTPASAMVTIADQYVSGRPGVFDPPDSKLYCGLSYLEASTSDGQLKVTVGLEKFDGFSNAHSVEIFLDTDQNPATGDSRQGHVAGPEYHIHAYITPDVNFVKLYRLPMAPGQTEEQLVASDNVQRIQGKFIDLTIPLALIGNPPAVDVFAFDHDGGVGAPITFHDPGGGDRAPDYGVIDTSSESVVVRQPGATYITKVSDPRGDDGAGQFDLTGVRFASVADQFFVDLSFAQVVDPKDPAFGSKTLRGTLELDSDQSLVTGDMDRTGGIPLGSGIPTWGGDARLFFNIDSYLVGDSITVAYNQFGFVPFGTTSGSSGSWNDGRWLAQGNTLHLASSLSVFDPFMVAIADAATSPQDVSSRVLTDGRMNARVGLINATSQAFVFDDSLPSQPGVVETATGRELDPLAWDPYRTTSANDPREFGENFSTSLDVTRVETEVVQGNLVVKGVLSGWLNTENDNDFEVLLDTDMDVSTGELISNGQGGRALGADYKLLIRSLDIELGGPVFYVASLLGPDGTITGHDAWLNRQTNDMNGVPGSFTVTIPLAALQGLGPQLRMFVTAGSRDPTTGIPVNFRADIAPPSPLVIDAGILQEMRMKLSDRLDREAAVGPKQIDRRLDRRYERGLPALRIAPANYRGEPTAAGPGPEPIAIGPALDGVVPSRRTSRRPSHE